MNEQDLDKALIWNESFKTGIVLVDEEHKKLFELGDQIRKELKGKHHQLIPEALNALFDYTKTHFVHEEQLMLSHGFNEFRDHKIKHENFIQHLNELKTRWEIQDPVIARDLYRFLSEWLISHVKEEDMRMCRALGKEIDLNKKNDFLYKELTHYHRVLSRLSPNLHLDELLKLNPEKLQSYTSSREKRSILFADIRGFTSLTENLEPDAVMEMLNTVYTYMEPYIYKNKGYIDKFMGDGLMAVFYAETCADDALQAAIGMQNALYLFNKDKDKPIEVGMGINTGEVCVGVLGTPDTVNFTLVGDQVNLASRLEQLTKVLQKPILLSYDTVKHLNNAPEMRKVAVIQVRGRNSYTPVFELLEGLDGRKSFKKNKDILEHAVELYRRHEFDHAASLLKHCLEEEPDDSVALQYLKISNFYTNQLQISGNDIPMQINESREMLDAGCRRHNLRFPITAQAVFMAYRTSEITGNGELVNISTGGLAIFTNSIFKKGDLLTLEIDFSNTRLAEVTKKEPFHAEVEVKIITEGQEGFKYFVGMEFISIKIEHEKQLFSILADPLVFHNIKATDDS